MLYLIVALLVIILDQWTKLWVATTIQGNVTAWSLIPDTLTLVNVKNSGAAFSFLAGSNATILFVAIAGVVALLVIIALATNLVKGELGRWSLTFIAAGGLSNAIDRVMSQGSVQDMIQLDFLKNVKFLGINGINFPIFNVADIFITVFCLVFILYVIFGRRAEVAVGVLAMVFGALLAIFGLRIEGGKAVLLAGGVIAALGLLFLLIGILKKPADGEKPEEEEDEDELEDDEDEEEEDERPLSRRARKKKQAEEAPAEAPVKPKKARQAGYEDDYERYKARKAKEAPTAPVEEPPVPVVDPGDPFAEWEKTRAAEKPVSAPVAAPVEDEGTVKMTEPPKAAPKPAPAAPKAEPAPESEEFSLEDILAEFR